MARCATPSPPPPDRMVTTPPAPRFGTFYDDWNPRRKSARISALHKTTMPESTSPTQTVRNEPMMTSPAEGASPRKRRQAPDTVRRASGIITTDPALPQTSRNAHKFGGKSTRDVLMTPSKTPKKAAGGKDVASVDSFARTLFSAEGTSYETPRKPRKSKKYSGMTLESFTSYEEEQPVEIFTDSRDRVPQQDTSAENPFWVAGSTAQPPAAMRLKRTQIHIPGEGNLSLEQALKREDGMVYTFRGKKVFRKYSQPDSQSEVKGRVLFPVEPLNEAEDEDATTDIEESNEEESEMEGDAEQAPQTPAKSAKTQADGASTTSKYEPISPPDTWRTKRTVDKLAASEPAKPKPAGLRNPFDGWLRRKNSSDVVSAKRKVDNPIGSPTKRSRVE